jgi:hypothetical protein
VFLCDDCEPTQLEKATDYFYHAVTLATNPPLPGNKVGQIEGNDVGEVGGISTANDEHAWWHVLDRLHGEYP